MAADSPCIAPAPLIGMQRPPLGRSACVRPLILSCNFKPNSAKHCHETLVPHPAKSPPLQPDVWGCRLQSDVDTLKATSGEPLCRTINRRPRLTLLWACCKQ